MPSLDIARSLLPSWALWSNGPIYVLLAFAVSLAGTALGTVSALWPLFRYRGNDWGERARLLYPGRKLAGWACFLFPVLFIFAAGEYAGPVGHVSTKTLAVLGGCAAYMGALLVLLRIEGRWGLKPTNVAVRLRGILIYWILFIPFIPVVALMLVLMPETLNAQAMAVLATAFLGFGFWVLGGSLFLARLVGLARPAPLRLSLVVDRVAVCAGIFPRAIYVIPFEQVNAIAFPESRSLAFTEPILDVMADEELAAITAHELGHLAEPWSVNMCRLLPSFLFLLLAAWKPIVGSFGAGPFLGLVLIYLLTALLAGRLARRMEKRADEFASSQEVNPGVYARALEKLYAANLMPVVTGNHATHPHLYDRLLAAGVEPVYPRPQPPSQVRLMSACSLVIVFMWMVWHGMVVVRSPDLCVDRQNEEALLRSIALDGGSAAVLGDLALIRYQRGDLEAAMVFYVAAGALDVQSVHYPANLVIILAECGRREEAEEMLNEVELRYRRNGFNPAVDHIVVSAREAIALCRLRT